MGERWKAVLGYEGLYEVSDLGRVRSLDRWVENNGGQQFRRGVVRTSSWRGPERHRMLYVDLWRDGSYRARKVHHLVLEAFVAPRPGRLHGLHGDGDQSNNRPENLRWGTRTENAADQVRHGKAKAKLTCRAGHVRTERNTSKRSDGGGIRCLDCQAITRTAWENRQRAGSNDIS